MKISKGIASVSKVTLRTLLAVFSGLAACDDEEDGILPPAGLQEAEIRGSYQATTLVVTEDGATTDVLSAGGSLVVTLDADGTASGDLYVSEGASDGSDLNEEYDGTWNFQDATDNIRIELSSSFFTDEILFSVDEGASFELGANDHEVGGTSVDVVLAQQ